MTSLSAGAAYESDRALAERAAASASLDISREKADYLFETIVCAAYESAVQIGAIAILLTDYARTGVPSQLRSFRRLLLDDSKVMLFALSYGQEVGLQTPLVESLKRLYNGTAAAKRRVNPLVDSSVGGRGNRETAQTLSQSWRRLAEEATRAIELVQEAVRARLNEVYQLDAQAVKHFLKQAAVDDRSVFDGSGALRLPALKQRRRLPRLAIQQACTLILPTGRHEGRLEDVSLQGLAVVCDAPISVGDNVQVALLDGRKLRATVARRQGQKLGLRLVNALAPSDPLFAAVRARG
jgi:PilZ domain